MGENEFRGDLYYRTDDGEVKLLPIKPLTISEIEVEQSKLELNELILCHPEEFEVSATIESCDEVFKAIQSIITKYELNDNLYIICEMAKRYLYLVKEMNNMDEYKKGYEQAKSDVLKLIDALDMNDSLFVQLLIANIKDLGGKR